MPKQDKSILIVEDEESVRESLCMILSEEGFRCEGVTDGKTAKELLAESSFDLMILDCRLSRINGITLLEEISIEKLDLNVILTTSYADWQEIARASELGVTHFMLKPLDFEELLETIRKILLL